ncbi:MAG: hypothetical protein ABEK02_09330 [Haloquadratum sp.]
MAHDHATPSSEAVRRSLRALADGTAPGSPDQRTDAAERTVSEAEAAVACVSTAARYLSEDRLSTLDAAIATATAAGADRTARRGRRARTTLERLDAAL